MQHRVACPSGAGHDPCRERLWHHKPSACPIGWSRILVAHALMRAVSALLPTLGTIAIQRRRHECRRGTHECMRHFSTAIRAMATGSAMIRSIDIRNQLAGLAGEDNQARLRFDRPQVKPHSASTEKAELPGNATTFSSASAPVRRASREPYSVGRRAEMAFR